MANQLKMAEVQAILDQLTFIRGGEFVIRFHSPRRDCYEAIVNGFARADRRSV